jgi:hypothetical protein
MFKEFGKRLMNEADDLGGGDGGAPADDNATKGLGDDTPPADDKIPPADDTPPNLEGVPEWAKGLKVDEEILKDPSLKAIQDLDSLTKSYVHAQRRIGAKGVIIPNENSTKEEWDTFYQKVGVPLEEQDYTSKVTLPQDSKLGEQFGKDFVKKAHELRIKPEQANKMYEFFNSQASETEKTFKAQMEEQTQQELNQLRDKLGEDAYNVRLTKAGKLIKEELGEEFHTYLKETGLGKNAKLVEAFMNLSERMYGEEKLPSNDGGGTLTKDQMQQEINDAMSDPKGPYLNSNHPDHKRKVAEIQKYFEKMG